MRMNAQSHMPIESGLFDRIIDCLLAERLREVGDGSMRVDARPIDPEEAHEQFAQHLQSVLVQGLRKIDGQDRLQRQLAVCNELVDLLNERAGGGLEGARVSPQARRLLAVLDRESEAAGFARDRPDTPLSVGCLLTGTRLDPSLVTQLRKEILSADRVDILCSFIKWSGIRILADELRLFTGRSRARLRVITTSYMGATDLKAVDFLQSLPRTELKVSYDTHRTRLHAKAYTFHRNTRFGTAYIGSANLSHAALTDGLEWNVKISQYEQPHQWEKITATFETYWNEGEFQSYEASQRTRLQQALRSERQSDRPDETNYHFDLRPYAFQQEILERIQAEREVQGRNRHLIVAATGTGKTMIAAFDFRAWSAWQQAQGRPPRLLFVAHREEILRQSLGAFRGVLRDQNFGDLMVGGRRPDQLDQLFVSIQTYNSQNLAGLVESGHYDYVVIDEFHHAAAESYQRLLGHITPQCLLGLTATPERADGLDILQHFDGHITAEIRLPDAINRKLLSPFQYFCVTDSENLDDLTWQRGGYRISELENVFTGNDIRAQLIVDKATEILRDVRQARGLAFCVSVKHAEYMARRFSEAGIPAACLTGNSPDDVRQTVQRRLLDREINILCVVDLYNEGVDIPEVDTVLFLRPTESLTVYLQQLGRGLRLVEGKDCLTVIDFVGRAHQNYRFDARFRSLLTDRGRKLDAEAKEGFPHLPAGCCIQMERKAREYILENIRQNLRLAAPQMVRRIATFQADTGHSPSLKHFLDYYELGLDDIYRRSSWSRLCVRAGLRSDFGEPDEGILRKGLRRLQHIDDPAQIRFLQGLLTGSSQIHVSDTLQHRRMLMAHFSLWGADCVPSDLAETLDRIARNPTLRDELLELLALRLDAVGSVPPPLELPFPCPLAMHCCYTRDEILAALGHWTLANQPSMREGVLHLPEVHADAFLVTLSKAEREYSPTTMYEDYAISDTLFHWQSQSTTSADSPTGRRYIEHQQRDHTILLFVRENKKRNGLSCPYHFLGPAKHVSHEGSRPISIVWRLDHPMPARLLRRTARMATA
jgi:superfamily II DNA or RNA helicase